MDKTTLTKMVTNDCDLMPLPPAIDLETKQILKKTITANRKLAELKGIINTIPNAAILGAGINFQAKFAPRILPKKLF
ncbi:MAG TPA: hypothetical protein EYP59_16300 [Thiotrichaceae bacterium]|nr:hypothetical protein [Thiotrichaceae bacterium]